MGLNQPLYRNVKAVFVDTARSHGLNHSRYDGIYINSG